MRRFQLVVLSVFLLTVAGCWPPKLFTRYIYVEDKKPLIEKPDRPDLPENPPTFTEREQILVNYTVSLEALIDEYNEWAVEENIENEYTPTARETDETDEKSSVSPVASP